MSPTPNFTGQRVVILHRPGGTTERLIRQLAMLGMRVDVQWAPLSQAAPAPDLVMVDADAGWSELFPWAPGHNPMPMIALLSSEAPGRIAWAIDQGARAMIAKPVIASAIFPALVMATRFHAEAIDTAAKVADLHERIRLRPLVLAAVQSIMSMQGCDEAAAYRCLRQDAMRSRLTLEHVAAAILAGGRSRSEAS
ncbi:ANTAR domain-containing response regulator [Lichenihabitans psoromatis]|uniref:ANTAR domain-containing response regulator n=1 Tax=Lichenihabitans psoromatis TaxID=2528642 RepID=UPI001035F16F|nr:ANTAR domain-containing protein [Lichenihabitans psoromatis]